MKRLIAATAMVATSLSMTAAKADDDIVFVGHLMDITGATGFIGKFYADGVR
ncbi:MAG TPA: branched-chain amino acid ABC transporter substrate-binding protein, partial [Thalassospira lucentensis]|nr:branched-chain amino acid ABC transporter substrate-binding protein [Thalassospira lucentensis]